MMISRVLKWFMILGNAELHYIGLYYGSMMLKLGLNDAKKRLIYKNVSKVTHSTNHLLLIDHDDG